MKVDQFENARKTRKKAQQTFFSQKQTKLVMTIIERIEKIKIKTKKSGKNNVISFPKPRMPHRIQFRSKFKTKMLE